MSATETPPELPDPKPAACPRCGAPLAPDQDWCLSCGAAASTRIAPPPSWRTPVVVVVAVLVLAAGALAVAFLELSDDAERVARAPAATASPTPTPSATPSPTVTASPSPAISVVTTPSPSPGASVSPGATASPGTTASPGASPSPSATPSSGTTTATSWPAGRSAWTIVLQSATDKAAAEKKAKELSAQGVPSGVLRSDDYSSLRKGYWVVFSGQYPDSEQAQKAADGYGAKAAGSYVRYVKPR